MRLLIVEDDAALRGVLLRSLRAEGFEADAVATGRDLLRRASHSAPDAFVIDIGLPDADGRDVCQALRSQGIGAPVLFLTARDAVEDKVAGLTLGADDYVTKPFSLEEVVARLRALMRRSGATDRRESTQLVVGDLRLDEDSHEVFRGADEISLTATEFELLRYLMRNPKRVLSKAQILDRVWQYDFGGQANIVELYVSYLRKKIDAGRMPMIHTLRGAGYVLKPADSQAP
jgi:two-component system, OmpR family, response regulator